ncbi:transporter [Pigmentiphaga aceris]|uniref:Transporter n=1 Tax=Pigmentiphaga aceris TaxID=1940612 RepID=A0A5C0AWL8_9BURK|nr:transporter [Pigmentiphaga aceris]QEI06156.1 transporter [Pigmentiphaga aceris]
MSAPATPASNHSPHDLPGNAYGSDEAGLICGYIFDADAPDPARAVDSVQAAAWLATHQDPATGQDGITKNRADGAPNSAYLWLHFNLSHAQAERWLHAHAHLPDEFFETLHEGTRSTQIERINTRGDGKHRESTEDALIAVINDVHFDFDFDPAKIATLWISLGPRVVVTARTKALRSVDALRTAVRAGDAPCSTTDLLAHLLRDQADVLVNIVRGVTAQVDVIEDDLLADKRGHSPRRLGVLRRVLVRLQRLLAPEPAALFRLLQNPPPWMVESDVVTLRGSTEEFSVVLRDMGALQERIKLLQEEIAAYVNEENNRSLYVLTVVTVLALPINILAGLFGMNVGGIPLAQHEHGFWIVVNIVLAFTAIAAWATRRRRKEH